MKPFYFGDSKNPLFGVFHPAQVSESRECGILICPPIAHEYVRTHRALRQLATALASCGFPVMRFDYFGAGDSAGESGEGGIARWTADIQMAIEELLALSSKKSVCLIGLRMGASLALHSITEKTGCKRIILWDPIVCGSKMLEELRALHACAYPLMPMKQDATEFVGFPYPGGLQQELREFDLLQERPAGIESVVILGPENRPDFSALRHRLEASVAFCVQIPFSDNTDWAIPTALDKTLVATNAIETIVTVLTGKM